MTPPPEQNDRHVRLRSEGIMMPKTDEQGRIYREVRCPHCRAFICDEYIRDGRVRFKCFRCAKIIIMEFRSRRGRKGRAPDNKAARESKEHE